MTDRPRSITFVCYAMGFINVIGFFSSLVLGAQLLELGSANLAEAPGTVRMFLVVTPFVTGAISLLGLYGALALWKGSRRGLLASLAWVLLWGAQELMMTIWRFNASPEVQQALESPGGNLVRIVIALVIFHYLMTAGWPYIRKTNAQLSSPRAPSDV